MEKTELMAKIKAAKSADEIVEIAKADGVKIALKEARKIFDEANKTGELSDDELDNVAGGKMLGVMQKSGLMPK